VYISLGYAPRRKGTNVIEDNLYAGTSEGEILHFFLDRQANTDNVTVLGAVLMSRLRLAIS
jgi:hypothetical protein